ncbi:MAG: hypothetical protein Q8K97_17705 [Pseudohongiella sp.]|nr:hypothetical protein [Pseudohongiella sp.]
MTLKFTISNSYNMTQKKNQPDNSKPNPAETSENTSKSPNTLHKIQVPSSPDFLEELDDANDKINEITKHNYKLKRSNVGRVLFKMYLAVADDVAHKVDNQGIHDDESFKEALIEAIKKMKK